MKQPTFVEGCIIAALASVSGAASFSILSTLLGAAMSARLTVTLLCSGYLLYLLWRAPQTTGRMTLLLLWGVVLLGCWLINPPFMIYLVIHLATLWLVRAFTYYRSIFSAGADLLLSGLSLVVALWAYLTSHSVLLALWCLFLVQALFVFIPRDWRLKPKPIAIDANDRFMRAHRHAESALRKLFTPR